MARFVDRVPGSGGAGRAAVLLHSFPARPPGAPGPAQDTRGANRTQQQPPGGCSRGAAAAARAAAVWTPPPPPPRAAPTSSSSTNTRSSSGSSSSSGSRPGHKEEPRWGEVYVRGRRALERRSRGQSCAAGHAKGCSGAEPGARKGAGGSVQQWAAVSEWGAAPQSPRWPGAAQQGGGQNGGGGRFCLGRRGEGGSKPGREQRARPLSVQPRLNARARRGRAPPRHASRRRVTPCARTPT